MYAKNTKTALAPSNGSYLFDIIMLYIMQILLMILKVIWLQCII